MNFRKPLGLLIFMTIVGGLYFSLPHMVKSSSPVAYLAYLPLAGRDSIQISSDFTPVSKISRQTITTTRSKIITIELDMSFAGIDRKSFAELQLIPFTERTKDDVSYFNVELPKQKITDNKTQKINVALPTGVYKLSFNASSEYFRDPAGYLFIVSETGIVRNSNLLFHFKLVSPSAQRLPPCRNFDWNPLTLSNSPSLPADKISEEDAVCQAERTVDISAPIKAPEPQKSQEKELLNDGYHFVGPRTSQDNQGVRGTNRVVDAKVDHADDLYDEFVAERVYARSAANSWMEAGWAEVSWRDDQQYIYEYDSANRTWNFFELYPLTSGTSVETLVRADGDGYWVAKIWWGSWHELFREYLGFTTATDGINRGEIYTVDGTHPILPKSEFSSGYLYIDNLWRWWDTRYSTAVREDFPYTCDMEILYYRFDIHSLNLYLPLITKAPPD